MYQNGTETNRNGTKGPTEPRLTKWFEMVPKCANLPHFGPFLSKIVSVYFDTVRHVYIHFTHLVSS